MLISHYYPNSFMARFEDYVKDHQFLHNRCTNDVDLIYCGGISRLDRAMRAKEEFEKPLICWVWDIPHDWGKWCRTNTEITAHSWREEYISKHLIQLPNCDKVISASRWTQQALKEHYDINSKQVYFYIDTEELDSVPSQPCDGSIIQISRFALNKRFDITIRACQGLDRKLVLVGKGDCKHLEKLASDLGVQAEFHCNTPRLETIQLLKQAELLVSPSVFEGWGITPIEALYCGKPVLLSDLEVFKEVYESAVPYHKQDDVEDMRKVLKWLLSDEEAKAWITEVAPRQISDFTIPKFVERWAEAIQL